MFLIKEIILGISCKDISENHAFCLIKIIKACKSLCCNLKLVTCFTRFIQQKFSFVSNSNQRMSFSWPFSFAFSNLNVLLSFYVFLLSFFFKFIANFELLESDVLEETKMSMDFRIVFSQLGIKSLYHVSS